MAKLSDIWNSPKQKMRPVSHPGTHHLRVSTKPQGKNQESRIKSQDLFRFLIPVVNH